MEDSCTTVMEANMEEERGEVKTDTEEVFSTEKPVAKKKKRAQQWQW